MILTCPSCNARYNVDQAKLGAAGRRVRCASCGNVWHQAAPSEESTAVAAAAAAPDSGMAAPPDTPQQDAPTDDHASYAYAGAPTIRASRMDAAQDGPPAQSGVSNAQTRRNSSTAAVLLWLLVLGSVAVAGLYLGREQVVQTWPASYRVYAELGIDVSTPAEAEAGLSVRRVVSERLDSEGSGPPRLVVTGELVNDSNNIRLTPRLMATLYDAGDRALFDWSFGVERERLEPGESVRFATALDNPDDSATRLEITVAGN
jgi:predicted Zn finger-like uncharacterized protein